MLVKTCEDNWEPELLLVTTGTDRLRTRTVMTVAKMPSVSASSLPLPKPGRFDSSGLKSTGSDQCARQFPISHPQIREMERTAQQ